MGVGAFVKIAVQGVVGICVAVISKYAGDKVTKNTKANKKRKEAEYQEETISYVKEHKLDEIITNVNEEFWVVLKKGYEPQKERFKTFESCVKELVKEEAV